MAKTPGRFPGIPPALKDTTPLMMRIQALEQENQGQADMVRLLLREKMALHRQWDKVEHDGQRLSLLLSALIHKAGGKLAIADADIDAVPNGVHVVLGEMESGQVVLGLTEAEAAGKTAEAPDKLQ